ncbi:polyketide synthase [Rhizobium rhizosphaerae]|uniref:Polyketide synthase n=1 Tax=Xaviernesmea rhizosphaerae TaxID=1672749 RepID=A0ABX3PH79_9HYPH|nr:type I polyketide synthase [Xaviernesmea rhizosphaerae]OQP87458.1 polyketide synthase [Xaviernesmea rhizosphaerae]
MTHAETPKPEAIDQEAILAVLREARARLETLQGQRDERVAIIGLAGRFPGADTAEALWDLLEAGRSGLRPVDAAELAEAGVAPERAAQADYVPAWGSFPEPAAFDAAFFGYSPRDAALLDPQQRVFLECAWAALEHAGYDGRAGSAGRIGVYAGAALNHHFSDLRANPTLREETDPLQAGLGNVIGMIAARTAYHLDLKGPTLGVQATCATSLVAVHLAARALLAGEADMALAGAVAIGQTRPEGYVYRSEGIASPDGLCRPFDADARGTVFTNGVGVVVLKRLSAALADGDTIHAVLRGSAIGNDGAAKVGLTAPSVSGQVEVLEAALADARIEPCEIDYVEAHGTATAMGDPIEIAALNKVYGPDFAKAGRSCAIGSVKGNLGHMDVAAGMGGLIKTILALRHRRLPASLHFTTANPAIDFAGGPFHVVAKAQEWAAPANRPRRAAISAFGMGGMNAHLIVEEGPSASPATVTTPDTTQLLPLSARSADALAAARKALAAALEEDADPAPGLGDIAFTLQAGRRPMPHRAVVLARERAEAARQWAAGAGADYRSGQVLAGEPSLVFLFPGQGAQHRGMARGLLEAEPAFRAAIEDCLAAFPPELDLAAALFGEESDRLDRTEVTQPALFAIDYALARMWQAKGVTPRAMLGHSLGEYVAACLAGVFSLSDAARLVCARGRLMQACAPGAMLSVMLSEAEARAFVSPDIDLAAVNGPRSTVLSGTSAAIDALAARFDRSGIGSKRLRTAHAFHSAMMEPALADFAKVLAGIPLHPPGIDILSNLTGDWLRPEQATDPAYWVAHLRQTVLFGPALAKALALPHALLLEVGPQETLTRLARQQAGADARAIATLPDAASPRLPADHLRLAAADLWIAGMDLDWSAWRAEGPHRRVGLPTYPFRRSAFDIPPAAREAGSQSEVGRAPFEKWFYQPVWTRGPVTAPPQAKESVWLLLGGAALAARIGPLPEPIRTIEVEAGATFAATGRGYAVAPADRESYRALFAALSGRGLMPDQIVNGFALSPGAAPDVAYASTLALGQALNEALALLPEAGASSPMPPMTVPLVTVLAEGLHSVTGTERLQPHAAMVLGTLRVLPQEIAGLACRSIDLTSSGAGPVPALRESLLRPFQPAHAVSALRAGFVFTQTQATAPMTEVDNALQPGELAQKGSPGHPLRAGATYLVTGDLVDGLALVYARALVTRLGARVILAGQKGLPPEQDWERWLASHGPQHPVSRMIRALREIGRPGTDYLLLTGDLADAGWLRRELAQAKAAFGPIHGVFHTSGMGDAYHCPLAELAPARTASLFATKIGGIQTLAQVLADSTAAFVLVQSSLSTLVGGAGLAAYAGANSFLAAFAEGQRGSAGPLWQAIDWDTCLADGEARDSANGLHAHVFDADEVWRVTQAVLARPDLARLAVTSEGVERRGRAATDAPRGATVLPTANGTGRQRVTAAFVAPGDPVEQVVAEVMGELLGITPIGIDDNFFELGGHSLLAVQVVTRLRKQFSTELPMRALLFDAPTIRGLAAILRERIAEAEDEAAAVAALLDDIEAGGRRREA